MKKVVRIVDALVGDGTPLDRALSTIIPWQRFQVSRPTQDVNNRTNHTENVTPQSPEEYPSGRFIGQIIIDPADPITIQDKGSIESADKRKVITKDHWHEEGYHPDGTLAYKIEHSTEQVEEMDGWKRKERPKQVEAPQPGVTVNLLEDMRYKAIPSTKIHTASVVFKPDFKHRLARTILNLDQTTFGMKVVPLSRIRMLNGKVDLGGHCDITVGDLMAAKASYKILDYFIDDDSCFSRKGRKQLLDRNAASLVQQYNEYFKERF